MKKVILFLASVIVVAGCFFWGCQKIADDPGELKTEKEASLFVNKEGIYTEIKKSKMEDNGFRYANEETIDLFSAYATFYIREAKKSAGLLKEHAALTLAPDFFEKLEEESELDITDIYCTVMLVDEPQEYVTEEMKERIRLYFDSLYVEESQSYHMPFSYEDESEFWLNAYPNYCIKIVSQKLELPAKPIDHWVEEGVAYLEQRDRIQIEYVRAYNMLFTLMEMEGTPVPPVLFEHVQSVYEEAIPNSDQLVADGTIYYLPVFFEDYCRFYEIMGEKRIPFASQVIGKLCENNRILKDNIWYLDTIGLNAVMYSLNRSGYDFKKCSNLDEIFQPYDSFLLDDSSYVHPSYTRSTLRNTYYVTKILYLLNLEQVSDITFYCEQMRERVQEGTPTEIFYFLELMESCDLTDSLTEEEIQKLIGALYEFTEKIPVDGTDLTTARWDFVNSAIGCLQILNQKVDIEDEKVDTLIKTLKSYDLSTVYIGTLSEILDYLYTAGADQEELLALGEELILRMEELLKSDHSYKLCDFTRAWEVAEKCGVHVPDKLRIGGQELLEDTLQSSGLYRSGTAKGGDGISFESTYDGLILWGFLYA